MRHILLTLWRREQAASDFEPSDPVDVRVCEVKAFVEWKGGGESEAGDQQQSRPTCSLQFRWGSEVAAIDSTWWATRDNQLTGETERFNFTSVANVGERNREVVIEAVRV